MFFKRKINVLFFILVSTLSLGQEIKQDSLDSHKTEKTLKLKYKGLILPAVLLGYGIVGLESHQILTYNSEIRAEVKEHIDEKLTIDDFSQYAPHASIYVLDVMGIKGKNNIKDKAIISATSYLIMGLTVNALKNVSIVQRPDGRSNNSFPSGHTATAFMGAELMHQEYKDVSIWYSISGYVVATGTGLFRMYNNRHWLTDVAAGASIGILSTKIAYWLHPTISKIFYNNKSSSTKTVFSPFYDGKKIGIGLVSTF